MNSTIWDNIRIDDGMERHDFDIYGSQMTSTKQSIIKKNL